MKASFILLIIVLSFCTSFSQSLLSKYDIKIERFGKDIYHKDKDNNLLNGLCKISDNAGNYSEVNFKSGKKEGKSIDYDYDGNIIQTATYRDGIITGETKKYYQNGKIKTTGLFTNGQKEGKWESFNDEGKTSKLEHYKEDKKTGKWEVFDKEGKIKTIKNYKNGLKTGKWWSKQYNSRSKSYIYVTKNYKNDVISGHSDEKNENGSLNWERNYKNYKNYTHKDYHPNGQIALVYSWKNSQWHGKRIKYDPYGTIISSKLYEYGKLIKPTLASTTSAQTKDRETINTIDETEEYQTAKVPDTTPINVDKKISDFNYKALVISNEKYTDDVGALQFPTTDAKNLINILSTKYNFLDKDIIHLKDATRSNIINTLDSLTDAITTNDNLLIFYAGHGYYDKKLSKGYWIPVNASSGQKDNWVSNGDIRDYITAMDSQHTLLISDACFSGSIFDFKQRAIKSKDLIITEKLLNKKSRKAMTSGLNKTVPDKSVFIKYLIKYLEENKKPYLRAGELYSDIRESVMANTDNNPQFEVIKNSNHEGGEFIFHQKN